MLNLLTKNGVSGAGRCGHAHRFNVRLSNTKTIRGRHTKFTHIFAPFSHTSLPQRKPATRYKMQVGTVSRKISNNN